MSQNNKAFKVRVTDDNELTFEFPPIPATCASVAVAIAENRALSSAKCSIIKKIEVEKI